MEKAPEMSRAPPFHWPSAKPGSDVGRPENRNHQILKESRSVRACIMPATDIGRKRIVSTAEMLRVPRPGGELHARILHRI